MIDSVLEQLRHRWARDEAVSEVVAYTFMFALGAIALTFAMQVMVDTQEAGAEVAAAQQVNQVGQVTATLVEQAGSLGQTAPNASFVRDFQLPRTIGGNDYTVSFSSTSTSTCPKEPRVHVQTLDEDLSESFPLANLTSLDFDKNPNAEECLELAGEFHSSSGVARIKYNWSADPKQPGPTVWLQSANQVT